MNASRILVAVATLATLNACGVGAVVDENGTLIDTDSALATKGRYETFVGQDGRYYFHLLAGNGEKVLASQGYETASGCQSGMGSVNVNGVEAANYELRTAVDGTVYFVLKAGNGEIVGVSEFYASHANAERGLNTVVQIVQYTAAQPVPALTGTRFETFKGIDGKHYFHLRAANGQIVLQSQAYSTKASATNGIASVKTNGVLANRYQVRAAADGSSYFVLKAANGKVIGLSEMYASKAGAQAGAEACQKTVGSLADTQ